MVVFVESKSHEELIENDAYSSIKSRLCTFKERKLAIFSYLKLSLLSGLNKMIGIILSVMNQEYANYLKVVSRKPLEMSLIRRSFTFTGEQNPGFNLITRS